MRLLCLHGHLYQPPRENPWLEEIEVQDSAEPFHDWNERIAAECYGPNGAARLKGDERLRREGAPRTAWGDPPTGPAPLDTRAFVFLRSHYAEMR